MAKTPEKPPAATPAKKPPIVDDPAVVETFADDFVGLYGIGPNFHLSFATRRPAQDGSDALTRRVTGRLVLPLDALLDMYNSLQGAVSRLESTGVIKVRPGGAKAD